jgi:hypothetical protein
MLISSSRKPPLSPKPKPAQRGQSRLQVSPPQGGPHLGDLES